MADSGRFAQLEELSASGLYGSSPTLQMKEYVVTDSTLRAVVWAPTISNETSCVLTMRADGSPPEQSCVNLPERGKAERRVALLYFAVLILAVGIRVALAGRSHAPIGIATVALTSLPFFLHPFWGIVRYSSWCDELVPVGYLWVAFAAMYLVRNAFFGSYEPPEPPHPRSNAPPRRPDGSRQFR